MTPNFWSQACAPHPPNAGSWQIASWQSARLTCLGIFDHFLVDEEHCLSWDEADQSLDRDALMKKILGRLLPKGSRLLGDFIPLFSPPLTLGQRLRSWMNSASRRLWEPYLQRRNFLLIREESASGHIAVDFGISSGGWPEMAARLGQDPDEAPDRFLVDAEDASWLELAQDLSQKFAAQSPFQHFAAHAEAWLKLLQHCRFCIIALDGHLYVILPSDEEPFFRGILERFAQERGWSVAEGHELS